MQVAVGATDQETLARSAERLWRGMPFLWRDELQRFSEYMEHRQEPAHAGELELWFERVQMGQCPIVGSGCSSPLPGSRFCAFHQRLAPARVVSGPLFSVKPPVIRQSP